MFPQPAYIGRPCFMRFRLGVAVCGGSLKRRKGAEEMKLWYSQEWKCYKATRYSAYAEEIRHLTYDTLVDLDETTLPREIRSLVEELDSAGDVLSITSSNTHCGALEHRNPFRGKETQAHYRHIFGSNEGSTVSAARNRKENYVTKLSQLPVSGLLCISHCNICNDAVGLQRACRGHARRLVELFFYVFFVR